jgi:hypothetical protein
MQSKVVEMISTAFDFSYLLASFVEHHVFAAHTMPYL